MGKRILVILLSLAVVAGLAAGGIFLVTGGLATGSNRVSAEAPDTAGVLPATEEDDDFGTVDIYAVLDDGTLDPAATGLTKKVWETFVRVVTPDFASEVMSQFRVGNAPESDTYAYVYQDENPDYWILAANLATSDDQTQLIATLVHEYAHILSLTGTEMDQDMASCSTIELTEGCARDDSYLLGFQQEFWAAYDASAPAVDNDDPDIAYDFYLAHEDDFVSDYAATNVVEDLAESFMTFVLEDRPDGATVTAAKLDFFWQYPELEAIRERIRAEFSTDLGLAA